MSLATPPPPSRSNAAEPAAAGPARGAVPAGPRPRLDERSPRTPSRRRWPWLVVIVLLAGGALAWYARHRALVDAEAVGAGAGRSRSGTTRGGGAPLPVGVATVQATDLPVYRNALGTVTPLHTVTIRTQISGVLMQLGFQEGQRVRQGDVLAVIDARPYENALAQAEGQLHQAQAQLAKARLDLERYQTLAQQDSVAKQQVDTAQSQVTQLEGLVQTSQAAIDTAKLNLNYCTIRAPIDGRVGLRQVDVGNYVVPGDANGIVVLTQTDPITVLFTLPEDEVGNIAARLRVTGKLPAEIYNRGLTEKIASGSLTTIDNQIDATTGTFKLRAEFANDGDRLFPNQFVNVRVLLDTLHNTVVIPTSAIERGQQGSFVYVVDNDNTVHARNVTLGPTEGERVAVSSGLESGSQIVVDGADKLKEGMRVTLPTEKSAPHAHRKT